MRSTHRELQARIRRLPQLLYSQCLASIHRPIVALAERVIRFEGPFAPLRLEDAGFDPLVRFLINYAEAGDALAIQARTELVQRERARRLSEQLPSLATDYWTEFFTVNKSAPYRGAMAFRRPERVRSSAV